MFERRVTVVEFNEARRKPVPSFCAAGAARESFLIVLDRFRVVATGVIHVAYLFGDGRSVGVEVARVPQVVEAAVGVTCRDSCAASSKIGLRVVSELADQLVVGSDSLRVVTGANEVRRLLETVDATRKLARLELSGARAELLGELGTGAAALERTLDQAAIALANEMVGGAQKVLETAVEYAKTRVQFGRPIGSFQAIKHKCADMLVEVEHAKSAAYYAAAAAAEDDDELPTLAPLAKSLASDAFRSAASESIQIHGGIGFTWEHPAHLYFKRAKGSEVFLGSPAHHRELLAQRLGVSA